MLKKLGKLFVNHFTFRIDNVFRVVVFPIANYKYNFVKIWTWFSSSYFYQWNSSFLLFYPKGIRRMHNFKTGKNNGWRRPFKSQILNLCFNIRDNANKCNSFVSVHFYKTHFYRILHDWTWNEIDFFQCLRYLHLLLLFDRLLSSRFCCYSTLHRRIKLCNEGILDNLLWIWINFQLLCC